MESRPPEDKPRQHVDEDTEAILSRRRFLIQSTLATAGLGVAASGCKPEACLEPQVCLTPAPPPDVQPQVCLDVVEPEPQVCLEEEPEPQVCLSVEPEPQVCLDVELPVPEPQVCLSEEPLPDVCLSVPAPAPDPPPADPCLSIE
jgi:hypothetical protein